MRFRASNEADFPNCKEPSIFVDGRVVLVRPAAGLTSYFPGRIWEHRCGIANDPGGRLIEFVARINF
jgi:hypothetical protein